MRCDCFVVHGCALAHVYNAGTQGQGWISITLWFCTTTFLLSVRMENFYLIYKCGENPNFICFRTTFMFQYS